MHVLSLKYIICSCAHTLCVSYFSVMNGSYLHVVAKIETENMYDCRSSCGQINYEFSFLQGFSPTSQETGTAVLSGLPGANPHRSACPESGICNARVHTVWVGTQKKCTDACPAYKHMMLRFRIWSWLRSFWFNFFPQWSASFWCFIAHSWLGWRPPLSVPVRPICMFYCHLSYCS